MRKITVTEDMWDTWSILHRESKSWRPKKPFCKLCSNVESINRRKWTVNYLKVGTEVYRVDFANDTFSLYHIECIDNPKNMGMQHKVETIKSLACMHGVMLTCASNVCKRITSITLRLCVSSWRSINVAEQQHIGI